MDESNLLAQQYMASQQAGEYEQALSYILKQTEILIKINDGNENT